MTVMFLDETPAVLPLGKLFEDHGYTYHWTSGQKPHLTKNGKELIAIYQTMCHSQSLVCRRVPLQHPHLLLHHLHHRILYLTSDDTPKIQCPKGMEVRVRSYGETRCINQKPKTKIKMKDVNKYKAIYYMNCRIGCRSSDRMGALDLGQFDLGQWGLYST